MSLLKTIDDNPLEKHEKKLTAVFSVILCLGRAFLIHKYLSNSDVLLLTRMITLKPEPEKKFCPDYDFLKSCLVDEKYVEYHVYNLYAAHVDVYHCHIHTSLTQGLV